MRARDAFFKRACNVCTCARFCSVLFLLLLTLCVPQSHGAITVLSNSSVTHTSLVFQPTTQQVQTLPDTPMIAYYDNSTLQLKLIVCSVPSCQPLDDGPVTVTQQQGQQGQWVSLRAANNTHSIMSFFDASSGSLIFARCNITGGANTCQQTVVRTVVDAGENNTVVGTHTSLAIGKVSGFARIAYRDETNQNLKLAFCLNANCSFSTKRVLSQDGNVGLGASLQINNGLPVISFYNQTGHSVHLVSCLTSLCNDATSTFLDGPLGSGELIGGTSLQLADGKPALTYYDQGALKYIRCLVASCSQYVAQVIDTGTMPFHSLQFKFPDTPVISFQSSMGLSVTTCLDIQCTAILPSVVDTNGGAYNSLQVGSTGNLVLSSRGSSARGELRLYTAPLMPTGSPTTTMMPTGSPTTAMMPTGSPTTAMMPTDSPTTTMIPTGSPTTHPTTTPTNSPTTRPTIFPTSSPTQSPTLDLSSACDILKVYQDLAIIPPLSSTCYATRQNTLFIGANVTFQASLSPIGNFSFEILTGQLPLSQSTGDRNCGFFVASTTKPCPISQGGGPCIVSETAIAAPGGQPAFQVLCLSTGLACEFQPTSTLSLCAKFGQMGPIATTAPTSAPSDTPTAIPTLPPTMRPTSTPSQMPTLSPTAPCDAERSYGFLNISVAELDSQCFGIRPNLPFSGGSVDYRYSLFGTNTSSTFKVSVGYLPTLQAVSNYDCSGFQDSNVPEIECLGACTEAYFDVVPTPVGFQPAFKIRCLGALSCTFSEDSVLELCGRFGKPATAAPTGTPSATPTQVPSMNPTKVPTAAPSIGTASSPGPTQTPTSFPSTQPTTSPTSVPTMAPSVAPAISEVPGNLTVTDNVTINSAVDASEGELVVLGTLTLGSSSNIIISPGYPITVSEVVTVGGTLVVELDSRPTGSAVSLISSPEAVLGQFDRINVTFPGQRSCETVEVSDAMAMSGFAVILTARDDACGLSQGAIIGIAAGAVGLASILGIILGVHLWLRKRKAQKVIERLQVEMEMDAS